MNHQVIENLEIGMHNFVSTCISILGPSSLSTLCLPNNKAGWTKRGSRRKNTAHCCQLFSFHCYPLPLFHSSYLFQKKIDMSFKTIFILRLSTCSSNLFSSIQGHYLIQYSCQTMYSFFSLHRILCQLASGFGWSFWLSITSLRRLPTKFKPNTL